jgi:curved DNA-binding protein
MDHYKTLGLDKTASQDDIKQAFRRLAMRHHPDRGGDEARFKEIQSAYDVLGDADRRAEYDAFQSRPPGFRFHSGTGPDFNFDAIFNMFGVRPMSDNEFRQRRPQVKIELGVDLADCLGNTSKDLNLQTHQGQHMVKIDIPGGIEDGETVRYPGLAPGGLDLLVVFRVRAHKQFARRQQHLYTDVPINLWQLITGTTVRIADLRGGELEVTIPPKTNPGSQLRLRGRGMPDRHRGGQGDIVVRIEAVMPATISPELMRMIEAESR